MPSACSSTRPILRQTGLRLRSLTRACRVGRATELVLVLATGGTLALSGGASAQTLTWDAGETGDAASDPATPGSGQWNGTDANWTDGASNVAFSDGADAVFGAAAGAYTVTIDDAAPYTVDAASIAINGDLTIDIDDDDELTVRAGGAVTVASGVSAAITGDADAVASDLTVEGDGTLTLSAGVTGSVAADMAGTLNLDGPIGDDLTQSAGTVALQGDVAVADQVDINGGTLAVGANTLSAAGFSNNSVVTVADGGAITSAGAIENEASGSITFAGGGTLDADTDGTGGAGEIIANAGALAFNGTGTTVTVGGDALTQTGTGTLAVNDTATVSGITTLTNTSTSADAITIADGATLTATTVSSSAGTVTVLGTLGGDVTISGAGVLDVDDGRIDGTLTLTGTGARTLEGEVTGLLTQNGTGSLTIDGASTLTGGFTNTAGTLTVDAQTALGAASSSAGTLDVNAALTGTATLTSTGATTIAADLGGALVVDGGTTTIDGDATITGDATVTGGTLAVDATRTLTADVGVAGGTLDIDGTVDGTVTVVDAGAAVGTGAVDLDGRIDGDLVVTEGSATVDGSGTNAGVTGAISTGADGTVTFDGDTALSEDLVNAGGVTVASGVTLTFDAGEGVANTGTTTVLGTLAGDVTGTGGVTMTGAGASIGGDVSVGADSSLRNTIGGALTVTGGDATVTNALDVTGAISVTGGELIVNALTDAASAEVSGTGTITLNAELDESLTNAGGAVVMNAGGAVDGTLTTTDGTTTLNAGTVTGDLAANGGTTTVAGTVGVTGAAPGTTGAVTGAGDLTVSGAGALTATSVTNGGTLTIAGTVTAPVTSTDELALSGRINGTLRVEGEGEVTGATARVTGVVTNAGELTVTGTLQADAGVTNEDTGVATDVLDVDGQITGTVTNDGTMELAGRVTDTLTNNGTLTVDGTATTDVAVVNEGQLTIAAAGGALTATGGIDTGAGATTTVNGTLTGDLRDEAGAAVVIDGTVTGAVASAGTLTLSGTVDGTVDNSADTATVTGASQVTGEFDNAGALVVNDVLTADTRVDNAATGTVTVNAGGSIAGAVNNANLVTLAGGGTGALTNLGTGTVAVTTASGGAAATSTQTGTLTNAGTVRVEDDATLAFSAGTLVNDATLDVQDGGAVTGTVTNNAGGTATIAGTVTGDIGNTGDVTVASTGRVTGTLTTNAGATLSAQVDGRVGALTVTGGEANIGAGATVDGTVDLNGGTLNVAGGTLGRLEVASGATANIDADATVTGTIVNVDGGIIDGTNTGTIRLTADRLENDGTIRTDTGSDQFTIDAGTILLGTNSDVQGNVRLLGRVENAGLLVLEPDQTLTNGIDNLSTGTLIVRAAIDADDNTFTNAGDFDVEANRSLTNAASFTNTDGTADVAAGGVLEADTITITGGTLTNSGGTLRGAVTNEATLIASGTIDGTVTTSGTFDLDGTLTSGDVTVTGGTTTIGATDELRGGDVEVDGGTLVLTGTTEGDVTLTDGTLTLASTSDIGGDVVLSDDADLLGRIGGTLTNRPDATATVTGALTVGGAASNAGTLTSTTALLTVGGTGLSNSGTGVATVTAGLDGSLQNTGTATVAGGVTGSVRNGATLDLSGDVDGDLLNVGGTATLTGPVSVGDALIVTDGTVDSDDDVSVTGQVNVGGAGTLEVDGNLSAAAVATTGGTAELTVGGTTTGDVTNVGLASLGGTVTGDVVNSGTLDLGANVTGDLTNRSGGTVTFVDGATVSGTFDNAATDSLAAGRTLNVGRLVQRAGTFTVAGTLNGPATVASGGTIALDPGGFVSGNTAVNGTLTFAGDTLPGGRTSNIGGTVSGSGLIDLRDGDTTDVLTVGALAGDGLTLGFDLDLEEGTTGQRSDRIVSLGAVTGDYVLSFALTDAPSLAELENGIVLIDGAPGSDITASIDPSSNFTSSARTVFVLQADAATGDLLLTSQLNPAIGGIAGNVALTQSLIGALVNRPTSPFVVGLAATSEPTCGAGAWSRAIAGQADASGSTSDGTNDLPSSIDTDYAGFQIGGDFACFNGAIGGFDLAFGATLGQNSGSTTQQVFQLAGFGGAQTDVVDSVTTSDFDQQYVGLYVTGARGPLVGDLQLRAEQTAFTFNNRAAAGLALGLTDQDLDIDAVTLSGSVSRSFAVGEAGWSVVPTAGFSYTKADGGVLEFDDGSTLTLDSYDQKLAFLGATVSRTQVAASGRSALNYFATGTYYADFSDDLVSRFEDALDDGNDQTLTSSPLDSYGEVSVGVNYVRILDGARGRQFSASARVDARQSSSLSSYGITGQVRWQW